MIKTHNMIYPNKYLLTLMPTLVAAAIACHLLLQRWNPYTLNGPQFLHFYMGMLTLIYAGYILSFTLSRQNAMTLQFVPAVFIWTAAGGIIRLLQGIVNERPVGFLLLLLIAHFIGYSIIRAINRRLL